MIIACLVLQSQGGADAAAAAFVRPLCACDIASLDCAVLLL